MQIQKIKPGYKLVKSLFGKNEEIPEDWEIKKFDELFEFLRTGSNSRSDLEKSGDIQYIHYGDIHTKWNLILDCDSEEIPCIDKTKVERLPLLKNGDLIIADASEDYEGSGASILLKNVNNKKIVSGLHTIALRSKVENISLDFKAFLISIKFVKKQIISYVTGISVYGLSKNNLKKVKIPLPTLPEQQKIGSILSNVYSLINQTQKEIEQTAILKKGLMQKLLTKGIGHTKFKKVISLFGKYEEIPSDWKKSQLLDLCKKKPEYGANVSAIKRNDKLPRYIRITDLNDDGTLRDEEWKSIEEKNAEKYILNEGDIVFARTGATVGKTYLYRKKDGKCAFAGYLIRFIPDKSILDSQYIFYLTQSKNYWRWLKSIQTWGAQPNVNAAQYSKMPILLPPLKEQEKISSFLSNVDLRIEVFQFKKSKLENLKKGLMQKLPTGQIRV